MIKISGLKKSYVSKKSVRVDALRGIDLEIGDRGLVAILGKSGCGKSTLLNIIGGLDTPNEGQVVIDGFDMFSAKSEERDVFRLHNIGIVFQSYNLLDGFTVGENVGMGLSMSERAESSSLVNDALCRVGLSDMEKRKVEELSGGQKQRVAIARAIVKRPNIILLDEPTGNLDSENSENIFNLLLELSRESLVLVVTHSEELALKYADSIIRLKDGKVISNLGVYCVKEESKQVKPKINAKKRVISPKVSFLIAMKNIKKRMGRLAVTMLLFVLVFAAIGVTLEGLGYDKASLIVDRLYELGEKEVILEYETERDELVPSSDMSGFNRGLIDVLNREFGDEKIIPVYKERYSGSYIDTVNEQKFLEYDNDDYEYYYYNKRYCNFLLKQDVENKFNVQGRLPVTNSEIAVTKYLADKIEYFTRIERDNILGASVKIDWYGENEYFTVVGIVDTNLSDRYKAIIGNTDEEGIISDLRQIMRNIISESFHNAIILDDEDILMDISVSTLSKQAKYKSAKLTIHGQNHIYPDDAVLDDLIIGVHYNIVEKQADIKSYKDVMYNEEYIEFFDGNKRELLPGEVVLESRDCMDYIENNFLTRVYYEDRDNNILNIPQKIKDAGYFNIKFYGDYSTEVKVVGYVRNVNYSFINDSVLPLGTTGIENPSGAVLVLDGNNRKEDIKTVRNLLNYNITDTSGFNLVFFGSHDIYVMGRIITLTNMVTVAVMLIFGIIGLILIIGFVDATIYNSEREAGILRSMGARGIEVGLIYAIEAIFIILISLVLGYAISVVLAVCSKYFYNAAFLIAPFSVAAWHLPLMIAVALTVAVVISLYPIYKMKRANPADMTRYKG